jgi:hypothetical protein
MTNYLTTLRGSLAASTVGEIFSHSLAVTSALDQSAVANIVRDTWQSAWAGPSDPTTLFSQYMSYTEATCATILDLHTGALASATHAPFSTPPVGYTANMLPTQVACAVSVWGGAKPNGLPYKGRYYLAGFAQSSLVATTGFLVSPLLVRNFTKDWMDRLIAAGVTPSVWSRKDAKLVTANKIRVGDRFDTIRRRRNAKSETYQITTP